MSRNYDAQMLCGVLNLDDEELKKDSKPKREKKEKQMEKYKDVMNSLGKGLPKVYLDCSHFTKLNKISFLWLMAC
jgi:hypothetical protein